MPQQAKGPRLYRRKDTGIYIIRDTGRGEHSTGTRERGEAEKVLAQYLAERNRPSGPATADQLTIARVLTIYAEEHAPHVHDPARIAYAITPLVRHFGDLPLSAITRETCRGYARGRFKATKSNPETGETLEISPIAAGTIRKELGVLAAAVNYCKEEGYVLNPPKVHLPPKPGHKDRWLTRSEAARLLWAAWRNPASKHLASFILIGLYTGTRKTAILRLRFMPNLSGGHVDTSHGLMYRKSAAQAATNKRQPPVKIAPRLLAHLRCGERKGKGRHVVEFDGQGVGSIKTAWATAVRAAGLRGTGLVPHTLRHTAITWAMQAGGDIYEASGYFGVSMETMFKVYAHHHPDYQKNAVAAIGRGGRKL